MTHASSPPTDEELVERMRGGEERALSELYDRHATTIYSLALAILRASADAEEVVADVFVQLWRSADYDADRGAVGAYLTVLARTRALDRIRARRRRAAAELRESARDPSGLLVPVSTSGPEPDHQVELGEERQRIRKALASLSDAQRTAIDLAFYGGLTHREIAERLAEPLGTVKTRIRDGMRKLRDSLSLSTVSSR